MSVIFLFGSAGLPPLAENSIAESPKKSTPFFTFFHFFLPCPTPLYENFEIWYRAIPPGGGCSHSPRGYAGLCFVKPKKIGPGFFKNNLYNIQPQKYNNQVKQYIEIGSNNFDTCIPLAENGWMGVMIEPVPEIYAEIERKTSGLRILPLNIAISDYDGEIEFAVPHLIPDPVEESGWIRGIGHVIHKNNKSMNNRGLLESPEGKANLSHTIKITCKKLDTLIEELNIEQIDYLKIDVEGHELNIIESYSWGIRPTFIKLETVHLDAANKTTLIEILKKQNYIIHETQEDLFAIG